MATTTSSCPTNNAIPGVADRQRVNNPSGSKNRSSTPGARTGTARSDHGMPLKPDANRQPSTQTNNSYVGPGGYDGYGRTRASIAQEESRLQDSWKHDARAGFLRKVYGILTAQLALTVAIAAMCMLTPSIRNACLRLAMDGVWWLQLAVLIPTMASLACLHCGAKDTYPLNYLLLFGFTLSIGFNVGYICSIVYATGHGDLILQALGITVVTFLGLSMYVLYAGKDFSYLGGFLYVSLWGLVITGVGALWFPQMVASLVYGVVGALTFCGYILYDTWKLQQVFKYDDYIPATIELYLDIINLFLYILDILLKLADKGKSTK